LKRRPGGRAPREQERPGAAHPELYLVGVRRHAGGLPEDAAQVIAGKPGARGQVRQAHVVGGVLVQVVQREPDRSRLASGRRRLPGVLAVAARQQRQALGQTGLAVQAVRPGRLREPVEAVKERHDVRVAHHVGGEPAHRAGARGELRRDLAHQVNGRVQRPVAPRVAGRRAARVRFLRVKHDKVARPDRVPAPPVDGRGRSRLGEREEELLVRMRAEGELADRGPEQG
jgi:hypothetical protein